MAFHQGAQHGTRAAGSGVGTAVAGVDGRVASEWVERSRVLSAAGIDRADVSLLEAGAADVHGKSRPVAVAMFVDGHSRSVRWQNIWGLKNDILNQGIHDP